MYIHKFNYPHIIAITESWLKEHETKYYDIENYYAIFDCRKSKGGGTILYVKKELKYETLDVEKLDKINISAIYLNDFKINIVNIYRAPKNKIHNFVDYLDNILNKNCIIIGDINLCVSPNNKSNMVKIYKNTLQLKSYVIQNINKRQVITSRKNHQGTIIDHIITKKDKKCSIKSYDTAISDHKLLNIKIKVKQKMNNIKCIKTMEKVDYVKIREQLRANMQNLNNIDTMCKFISETKKRCTYLKRIKIINNNKWYNHAIQRQMKLRDKAYRKMKKYPNNENFKQQFNILKKETNYIIKKTKKEYINNQLIKTGTDSKKMWKLMNNTLNVNHKNSVNIHKLKNNNKIITNDKEIAITFNDYFINVAENLQRKIPIQNSLINDSIYNNKCIYLKKCNELELKNVIFLLKITPSKGDDEISTRDIKEIYFVIKDQLLQLINECLKIGEFPSSIKITKVIPIHKKGKKEDISNYRPISITSTISKIIEKVIKARLIEFLELSAYQYGFQDSSSTLGVTTDLLENIIQKTDNGFHVATVFIDLRKAFDTVDHQILLKKLHDMGIQGPAQRLLKSFLEKRQQYVTVNGAKSTIKIVKSGIPQGSVLGPLLYLLYVESISQINLSAKYYMFADDTVLVISEKDTKNLEIKINENLIKFYKWLCQNKLVVNENKTVYMIFNPKRYDETNTVLNIKINSKTIEKVTHYTYLGLVIDNKLNWGNHVDMLYNKLSGLICCMKRISNLFTTKNKLMLYNAHINSILTYLIAIWGNTTQYNINRVQRLQNRAIKNIFKLKYDTSTKSLYESYPILPIRNLIKKELCTLVYKINNDLLKSNIIFKKSTHQYSTRHKDRFPLDKNIRSEYGRKRPTYVGAQLYNQLPKFIRNSETLAIYKKNLTKYIYNNE